MTDIIDAAIEYSILVRSKPEKVYDGIATAEGLDSWFTTGAEVDPRSGGHIKFNWINWGPDKVTNSDGGPVIEANKPEKFVFQWQPDSKEYYTTVEINFEEVAEGTIIRLREYGYRDTPEGLRAMLGCAGGWGEALTLWKMYIEHGVKY